jgi:hypothetical protein
MIFFNEVKRFYCVKRPTPSSYSGYCFIRIVNTTNLISAEHATKKFEGFFPRSLKALKFHILSIYLKFCF